MRWNSSIKAGALQFVLFIGAIIAVLLMAFLLISHTHSYFDKKTEISINLFQAAEQALYLAFEKDKDLGDVMLPNNDENNITVEVSRDRWGVFEKWTSKATHQNQAFVRTVLAGAKKDPQKSALYLQDKQRPLIIAGGAKITGDAYLPEQGIRPGNIAGQSYYRDQLLYGNQKQSTAELPILDPGLLAHLQSLMNSEALSQEETIYLSPKQEVKNSFQAPTKVISGASIRLEGVRLAGNVLIRAYERIIVEPNARLQDIILVAPEIIIEDRVTGYFQAVATERITVGKNSLLGYPSALVVLNDLSAEAVDEKNTEPNIILDNGAEVRGLMVYLGSNKEQSPKPRIKISEKSRVLGEIYCSKSLELKGQVSGSVMTASFMARENGSIYQNHLFHGTINSSELPASYAGLIFNTKSSKTIGKWLY
ncbi:MAG: hypothetical protein AB3N14_13235 [Flavobacteriaceae bacterium]